MSEIRITHAVSLSGSILLVIVNSAVDGKSDAILLVASCEDVLLQDYISKFEQTLLSDDIQSSEHLVDVTFEVEEGLYDRAKNWCAEVGISIEQLALAFMRFCACTDNHAVLKEWFSPGRMLAELNATIDELHSVREELLEMSCLYEYALHDKVLAQNP